MTIIFVKGQHKMAQDVKIMQQILDLTDITVIYIGISIHQKLKRKLKESNQNVKQNVKMILFVQNQQKKDQNIAEFTQITIRMFKNRKRLRKKK
jgi:hypothetical protein